MGHNPVKPAKTSFCVGGVLRLSARISLSTHGSLEPLKSARVNEKRPNISEPHPLGSKPTASSIVNSKGTALQEGHRKGMPALRCLAVGAWNEAGESCRGILFM